jgi:hypothetical protein
MSELCVTTVFLSVLECNGSQEEYWYDRILCGLERDTSVDLLDEHKTICR